MTDAEFLAWCAQDNQDRCVVVELDYVIEVSGAPVVGTLYLTDKEYHDVTAETILPFVDCINSVPQFTRSLSGDRLGAFTNSIGSLELDNADGELDFVLSLAIDGSEARFMLGGPKWVYSDFRHIFTALSSLASAPSWDRMSITLKTTDILLNKSIGGTVLVGGTGPVANQARSFNFGYVHNMQPPVVDPTLLIYAHSDTGTDTIAVNARDKGVAVTFTDNADGTATLAAPPAGTVTFDVQADPGSAGRNVSNCFDELIGVRCGLSAARLYAGNHRTFVLHDDDDYLVGLNVSTATNVVTTLADLTDSCNCSWAITRLGSFTYLRLRPQDIASLVGLGTPPLEAVDIVEDDIDEGSWRVDHSQTLYYQYQATMSRNWLVQTDLATSLTAAEAGLWTRKGIYLLEDIGTGTTYNDAPQLYNKSLTVSPVVDTLLSGAFDELDLPFLQTALDTRRVMFLPWIERPGFTTGIEFYKLELGDIVNLTAPRYDFDTGVLFQVMSINIILSKAKIEFILVRRRLLAAPPVAWTKDPDALTDTPQEYALSRPFVPPLITTDPPPIRDGGAHGISISSDGHPVWTPVTIGSSRFFRPPLPPTDGYIVLRHDDGTTQPVSEGGDVFVPGQFMGPGGSFGAKYDSGADAEAYLIFSTTIPTIDGVTGQLAVIDSDGKFEFSGNTDGGGDFNCPCICIPAYSWELPPDFSHSDGKFIITGGNAFTTPGIVYEALNNSGNFGAAGSGQTNIFALKFWADRTQYIAYMVRPDTTNGPGQPRFVGVTVNPDLRAAYGGYTTPPERIGATTSTSFASGGWVNGSVYREPILTLPRNESVFISGPSITSPLSGFAVTAVQGTVTETSTEAVPPNDNFASSSIITGGAVTNQLIAGVTANQFATTETSEPCGVGTATKTAWWNFTPVSSGTFSCKTIGSYRSDDGSYSNPLNTVITVYTGAAVGSLTQIATNDDGGTDVTSDTGSFAVTGGVKYSIQVSVKSGTGQYGAVKLTYTTSGALVSPPVITTTPNPGNPIIQAHTSALSIAPAASNSPTSWSITWLNNVGGASTQPTGISFNTSTGVVSGTATAGNSPGQIVQIFAINAAGTSAPYQVVVFLT